MNRLTTYSPKKYRQSGAHHRGIWQESYQMVFALFLVGVLLLSACGTIEIGLEPTKTASPVAGSAIEESQETITPNVEDPATAAEASPPKGEVDSETEATQLLATNSEITDLDETWNLFTDYRLGFSIKFPKEMATLRGSCAWNQGERSYRPEVALVPVQIFEESNAVYIAAEHFYELAGERRDGGKTLYGECNPVTNSLDLLQDPDSFKEPFWKLVVEEVRDDAELDNFIKERYGPGCSVGEQLPSLQEGVYEVKIEGDGKVLAETQCPLNFATAVKYFPAGGKIVAWDRGQSYYFPADVNYAVVHDQEMEDSFRFLTGAPAETGGDPLATVGYSNSEYGFVLDYPPTWTAAEVNGNDFVGPGSRSVQFSQGTVTLVIGYRRKGESVAISGSGAPGGEFAVRGTVRIAGQDVDRYVIVYQGKDKVVMYGEPGPLPLSAGGLEFSARLDDFNPDYDSVELSRSIQGDADLILGSLALIEAGAGS